MSRPRTARRNVRKELYLPEELVAAIELRLFSALEGRVPYRAWSALVAPLLEREITRAEREARLCSILAQRGSADALSELASEVGMYELNAMIWKEPQYEASLPPTNPLVV